MPPKCILTRMGTALISLLLPLLICATDVLAQELDLTILDDWITFSDAENALYRHLNDQAQELLKGRKKGLENVHTLEDWQRRQAEIKQTLHQLVGPFPERTPLNPRVMGTLEREQFRVEKILYESQPGYYVTAALFIPRLIEQPAPGILFCSGHTSEGFRSEVYQTMILNLVHKGFVVLAFDPVGQGERQVHFSDTGEPFPGGPTHQHSYPGAQQFILGQSPARSMIWDGIRGIDYLVSRPEVDPDRIGVTGRSGGGTQTAYIAAFDERVVAAAPEAYIAGFSRLMNSRGPQDAEQNFFHGIRAGIDHADLLAVRAPRPTLIISTTRDFFSIQGARETFHEVQRIYSAYEAKDALRMVEDNANHATTVKNREAMYGFFQRTFEIPGTPSEESIPPFSDEELQVTPGGQVALLSESRSIFSLIQEDAEASMAKLEAARKRPGHFEEVREQALLRSGYQNPDSTHDPVFVGRYQREAYTLEKYFIQGEGDYPLPYIALIPDNSGPHPLLVYLHPKGKPLDATSLEPIESWVRAGYMVLLPDLPGLGELGPGAFKGDAFIDGVSYNTWFASILIGRSLTAIQAADLNRMVYALMRHADVDEKRIVGVAMQSRVPVLLYAAVAQPFYQKLIFGMPLVSNARLVTQERYTPVHIPGMVAGSFPYYDIPDLAGSLAPLEITLIHPEDPIGRVLSLEEVHELWEVAVRRYAALGVSGHLKMYSSADTPHVQSLLHTEIKSFVESNLQN